MADFGADTNHEVDFSLGGQDQVIDTATYIFKKTLSPQWGGAFVLLVGKTPFSTIFFVVFEAHFPPVQKKPNDYSQPTVPVSEGEFERGG